MDNEVKLIKTGLRSVQNGIFGITGHIFEDRDLRNNELCFKCF